MAIPALALSLIPTAGKLVYNLFNKPKKDSFENKHTSDALQRIISNNQADIVNKTLLNQTTAAAKSLGSRLYQQNANSIDIAAEKGLLTEGQKSRALLNSATDIQSKVGEQQQSALQENAKLSLSLQDKVDQASLQLGQLKDQAEANYGMAKDQWKADIAGGLIDAASIGANMLNQKFINNDNASFMEKLFAGKSTDLSTWSLPELTGLQFQLMMRQYGYKLPGQ